MYSNSEREGRLFQKLRKSEAEKLRKSEAEGSSPVSRKPHTIFFERKQNKSRGKLLVALGSGAWSNNNKGMTRKRSGSDKKTQQPRIKDAPNHFLASQMPPQNAGGIPDNKKKTTLNAGLIHLLMEPERQRKDHRFDETLKQRTGDVSRNCDPKSMGRKGKPLNSV
jgi:hypothetical protein